MIDLDDRFVWIFESIVRVTLGLYSGPKRQDQKSHNLN